MHQGRHDRARGRRADLCPGIRCREPADLGHGERTDNAVRLRRQRNMAKKINPDGSRTIYIAGNYEVRKNSSGTVTGSTTYYPAVGAMREVTGTDVAVYYTLGDQLGSTSMVIDASGTVMGTQGYYLFGETSYTTGSLNPTESPITVRLYTGQQRERRGFGADESQRGERGGEPGADGHGHGS
jgi:hypothetical protein